MVASFGGALFFVLLCSLVGVSRRQPERACRGLFLPWAGPTPAAGGRRGKVVVFLIEGNNPSTPIQGGYPRLTGANGGGRVIGRVR